jgi:Na+/H+ antiporter NhaD/arsenite permease-like protein
MSFSNNPTDLFATLCFLMAILHTFSVKRFQHFAHRFESGSAAENFFHLLGEVEVVFGLWAAIFLIFLAVRHGTSEMVHYLEAQNFTEPGFVLVIMTICATRPILSVAGVLIDSLSRLLPFKRPVAFYATCLTIGPILGSFITEPAAMTVSALILLEKFYKRDISQRLMYATIGLLFVNISIGGTLTPYAAPPVLMVAKTWHWNLTYMLSHFGWKAVLSIIASTALVTVRFRKELAIVAWDVSGKPTQGRVPVWVTLTHLGFLAAVVVSSHYLVVFAGIFLFFLGLVSVTREHQEELALREGLLVAFFLGGLVVLGGPQRWWLEPILTRLETIPLFLGSISLTAITDNAALTYLGAQVPGLSEASRYALVAGAVTGGGLTVVANAPNPAGYGILNSAFGEDGISPVLLLMSALPPTLIAAICFWSL